MELHKPEKRIHPQLGPVIVFTASEDHERRGLRTIMREWRYIAKFGQSTENKP